MDEGDLTRSVNADIPGTVIRPGLEMVIEIDPDGTLDASLGIAQRVPATGRMAVDVADVPDFQLTLVPFLYEPDPDSAVLKITAGMASDPEGHEMLAETGMFLPIGGWDVELHGPVLTSTDNGFRIRNETEMIRLVEGRPGYWLAMLTPIRDSGLFGVAYGIGSWTSFSIPVPQIVAHEIGHNMGLFHAPCGGAGGPDPLYPHAWGVIGSWGYDREHNRLISPYTPDLMSYCGGQWIGDYHVANALRHRVSVEVPGEFAPKTRSAVVWGGLDSNGDPYLEPSFITDAMPSLPPRGRDFVVRGTTVDGSEAFSFTFDMPETWDVDDERSGFVFAIPVTWPEALGRVSLTGGNDSAILDGSTDSPMTILRDPVTGEVRAILRRPAAQAVEIVGEPGLEVLFSPGDPGRSASRALIRSGRHRSHGILLRIVELRQGTARAMVRVIADPRRRKGQSERAHPRRPGSPGGPARRNADLRNPGCRRRGLPAGRPSTRPLPDRRHHRSRRRPTRHPLQRGRRHRIRRAERRRPDRGRRPDRPGGGRPVGRWHDPPRPHPRRGRLARQPVPRLHAGRPGR